MAYSFCSAASSIGSNVTLGQSSVAAGSLLQAEHIARCERTQQHDAHSEQRSCPTLKSDHLCVFVAEVIALQRNVAPHKRSRSSRQEMDAAAYYVVEDPNHVRLTRLLVYSSQAVSSAASSPAAAVAAATAPGSATAEHTAHQRERYASARMATPIQPSIDHAEQHGRAERPSAVAEHARTLTLVILGVFGMLLLLALISGGS